MASKLSSVHDTVVQVRLVGFLLMALIGTLGVSSRWIVSHAVTDALVEHGVVKVTPAQGGKVTWDSSKDLGGRDGLLSEPALPQEPQVCSSLPLPSFWLL